jgi:ribulose-phosphate 3-epimerase
MVVEPEKVLQQWLIKPVSRIIVHLEAASDMELIIQKCREAGIEIGIAINPETFWGKLRPWCGKVDLFQILAVKPGPSGQKMDEGSFDKISHLRHVCSGSKIEIDGGINPETAKKAKEAGANILVAGAYIFGSLDIEKIIEDLSD